MSVQPGDILYFSDFVFRDGGHADKLLVVVAVAEGNALMVISTSKGKREDPGCQPIPQKFFFKAGTVGFPKNTWLDLARRPTVAPLEKIELCIQQGKIVHKGTLPQTKLNEVRNCLTKHALDSLDREMCNMLGIKPKW